MPKFNQIYRCRNPHFKDTCRYQTCILRIIQSHHVCQLDLRLRELPLQKPFWYSLFPKDRPTRGFPKTTKTVRQAKAEEKQATPQPTPRSSSSSRRSQEIKFMHSSDVRREVSLQQHASRSRTTIRTTSSATYEKRQNTSPEVQQRENKSRKLTSTATFTPSPTHAVTPVSRVKSTVVSTKTSEMTSQVHESAEESELTEEDLDYDESMLEVDPDRVTPTLARPEVTTEEESDAEDDAATTSSLHEEEEPEEVTVTEEITGADASTSDEKSEKLPFPTRDEVAQPNYNELEKYERLQMKENTSSYTQFRRNYNCNSEEVQRGLLIFSKGIFPKDSNSGMEHYTVHVMDTVNYGEFYITDYKGMPIAKATVTPHMSVPAPNTSQSIYRQFNPNNYPVYCELVHTRFLPTQTLHFMSMSTALDVGSYRLVPSNYIDTTRSYMFHIRKHKEKFGVESPLLPRK